MNLSVKLFIYLIEFYCLLQYSVGHILIGSSMGRRNQFIQLVKILYCKLPTISKQLQTLPHRVWGLNCRPHRWETSVLPQHHCSPLNISVDNTFEF